MRRLAKLAALIEHLHDDGRRGHHEARRADGGCGERQARCVGDPREQRRAGQDLRGAQAEDFAAQIPELARAHLEADDEQEQDDSELCDVQQRVGVGHDAEAVGADHEAGGEVTEHRAQAEPAE